MNIVGLFLEESEERDYVGIISFIALSYIVVPFQAYAAIKGFLESSEGPWFRTPKTGAITDVFGRSHFAKVFGNIFGRPAAVTSLRSTVLGLQPKLALATAYNQFSGNLNIRPRRFKWVGKAALVFILTVSISLVSLSPSIPVFNERNLSPLIKLVSAKSNYRIDETPLFALSLPDGRDDSFPSIGFKG